MVRVMTIDSAPDDDPFVTTREAAQLLGVSLKTAQVWFEQGGIDSWKTPGGHRRAKRSAVLALRRTPVAQAKPRLNQAILMHRTGEAMQRRFEQLQDAPFPLHVSTGDLLELLIDAGSVTPELLIIDLNGLDLRKFEMLRRITATPRLTHMKVIALGDLTERELRSELGATDRVTLLSADAEAADFLETVHSRLGWPAHGQVDSKVSEGSTSGFATPVNEAARLMAVQRSGLAGAAPEKAFDDLMRLAAQTLDVPICLLSILTADQQWFKSHWGLDVSQTPRAWSFCNHTIQSDRVFVVPDAGSDARFQANPLVLGYPNIRFYAGFSVKDLDGFPLGALCVIDRTPRTIGARQIEALYTIASAVEDKINLRLRERQLRSLAGGIPSS
jgi:excisionase family DNA binding protein